MPQEQFDLIVVGGSVGGLAAAVTAADRGCRTVVLERAKELGGGAGLESEVIAAAGTRFQEAARIGDAAARLADDILAATGRQVDPALVTALAAQGAPLVAWLADRCGVAVELLAASAPGHSVPRLHLPGERGGAGLIADLTRAATRHSKVSVRTGTLAERLLRDESGGVRGLVARAERRGASVEIAGSVLLACGGFAAADARVAEHCPAAAALPYHGSAGAVGEALRLGAEVGARTVRLGACRVTPFLAMPGRLVLTVPLVELGAILVNQAGRRFVAETGDTLPLAETIRAQPGKVAYLFFDERIAEAARATDPFFGKVQLPRVGRRGLTLTDLSRQFELDADALEQTVDAWNGKAGDSFGRTRRGAPFAPPFHAVRVTGARWRTLGGLAVDDSARVLADAGGQPIPRLYAAGGAAEGLGGERTEGALAGTDALAALGLARLAALDVVRQAAARNEEPT
jgi:fumarate reductase flavoprotein subunit